MILSIQYLRGLAALLVLLSHAAWKGKQYAGDPLGWFHIGAAGVDIFFVISGFVMCHTTRVKNDNPWAVAHFLGRRFSRILPLYWTLSTVALLVFLLVPSVINSAGGKTDILKSFLLIPSQDRFLIEAGWTLSYEFFFYVIFALGLLRSGIVGHVLTCSALMALFLGGRLLESASATEAQGTMFAFVTDAILLNFVFGIALYHLHRHKVLPLRWVWLVLLSGFIWLVAVNQGLLNFHFRCVRYGVPAFLVCWGLIRLEDILRRAPSNVASYIGDASYSIYLLHPFALALVAIMLKQFGLLSPGWLFLLISVAVSLVSGLVCYALIEKPMLNYFRPKADRPSNRLQ